MLTQRVGVNAFSYGDLAELIGIAAPSIHHHFRTKDDLIAEVAERYRVRFADRVGQIDAATVTLHLCAYAELFDDTSSQELMCFCGSVAAEWASVGQRAREQVALFFDEQRAWLASQIRTAVDNGEFRSDINVDALASAVLAALEGSMLLARSAGNASRFASDVLDALLNLLTHPSSSKQAKGRLVCPDLLDSDARE